MKKILCLNVALLFLLSFIGFAWAHEDLGKFRTCRFCGMDRAKFAKSRVLIEYDDGTAEGTCSIHCAAVDLANNIDKFPQSIRVGDYNTQKLIDAEKASWVIVDGKPGVMTRNAKWAFEHKQDAEKFIAANGGRLTDFDQAMKATYEDMYADIKMIREKRKMMKKKMKMHMHKAQ